MTETHEGNTTKPSIMRLVVSEKRNERIAFHGALLLLLRGMRYWFIYWRSGSVAVVRRRFGSGAATLRVRSAGGGAPDAVGVAGLGVGAGRVGRRRLHRPAGQLERRRRGLQVPALLSLCRRQKVRLPLSGQERLQRRALRAAGPARVRRRFNNHRRRRLDNADSRDGAPHRILVWGTWRSHSSSSNSHETTAFRRHQYRTPPPILADLHATVKSPTLYTRLHLVSYSLSDNDIPVSYWINRACSIPQEILWLGLFFFSTYFLLISDQIITRQLFFHFLFCPYLFLIFFSPDFKSFMLDFDWFGQPLCRCVFFLVGKFDFVHIRVTIVCHVPTERLYIHTVISTSFHSGMVGQIPGG